ncbi:putative integral membrane transport protein [Streptomyces bingchenggensis BCW-1]|uniref:Putative integral membrane transport protein n=1 Tax=Streptomyces bingchenggensis (strain BCW-1) TaxID=749414 RepID=D7BPZ7_STRBB|nr:MULTISPECIES: carbohydrate ABC transporter permease [Streptomyces]ADI05004.1 putative integral membrane transport protein [Streptomyces bingchenggensis BCW-1]
MSDITARRTRRRAVWSAGARRDRAPLSTRFILTVTIIALTAYFLIPIAWMLIASTKSTADLNTTFGLWFSHFDLMQNLHDLFAYRDGIFRRWVVNSLIYSGGGALGSTFLAALCGFALAKYRFRGRNAIMGLIFGGVLIPGTVLALPTYLLLNSFGLINTYWAVILPSLSSAFGVFLVRIYAAAAVPDELLEAGRIDGAHDVRIFFTVVLRILLPSLVTVFLFSFISIWNNFLLPLIVLNDQSLWPVTLGLYSWQMNAMSEPDLVRIVVTGSMVGTIPLVVLFLTLQKYWRSGITTGALK